MLTMQQLTFMIKLLLIKKHIMRTFCPFYSVNCSFPFIQIQTIQRLKDERDNNLQQNQQMQRELVLYIDIFTLHVVSTHCFSSVQILV